MKKLLVIVTSLAMLLAPVAGEAAAVTSNVASVPLSVSLGEYVTVSVGAAPTFTSSGFTATSSPISVTTAWGLSTTNRSIWTVGYFATPSTALTDGTTNIPSSSVTGAVAPAGGKASSSPCNLTDANVAAATAGGACPDLAVITTSATTGSETDTITLTVNFPSGTPPTGNGKPLTGVLNIVAATN